MPDDQQSRGWDFATRLVHGGRPGTKLRAFVNPPVHSGSTMLHADTADRRHRRANVFALLAITYPGGNTNPLKG